MKLETYQIETIKAVFAKCYGLQDCIVKDLPQSLESLASRTAFRLSFLTENLTQIKSL